MVVVVWNSGAVGVVDGEAVGVGVGDVVGVGVAVGLAFGVGVTVGFAVGVGAGDESTYNVCKTSSTALTAKFSDSPHLSLNVALLHL